MTQDEKSCNDMIGMIVIEVIIITRQTGRSLESVTNQKVRRKF